MVDGSSTDGTADFIQEYEPKFQGRMRWFSEPHSGIYDAMNKGIHMAKGDYINFMTPDNWFADEALSATKKAIVDNPGQGVYYGMTRIVNAQGQELIVERFHHSKIPELMSYYQSQFISRSAIFKIGLFDTQYRVSANYDMGMKLSLSKANFCPMEHLVAVFRIDGLSDFEDRRCAHEENLVRIYHGLLDGARYRRECLRNKLCRQVTNVLFGIYCVARWPLRQLSKLRQWG